MRDTGPFDLHGSSTPPAFILSQDQTLRKFLPLARLFLRFRLYPCGRPQVPVTLQLLRCGPRVGRESPCARRGIEIVSGHAREHSITPGQIRQIRSSGLRRAVGTLLSSGKDPLALQPITRCEPGRAVFPASAHHSTLLGPRCQVWPLALPRAWRGAVAPRIRGMARLEQDTC